MKSIKKAIISSVICNVVLWYGYTLFGVLIYIISDVFFSSEGYYIGLIKALSVFAIGFLARPFGAIIFGYIGDKYGRRIALLTSTLLMSASSAFIAFIPSYRSIGIFASLLIAILRLLQGMAMGGEVGSSVFLIENADNKKNLGFLGSIKVLSGMLGSIICLIVIVICKKTSDFDSWGWRLPFIFSLFMGFVAICTRFIFDESYAYQVNKKNLSKSPILEFIKYYKRLLLISIGIGIAQNASVYALLVFFKTYIREISPENFDITYIIEIFGNLLYGILAVSFAILSDKVGKKVIMVLSCVTLAITSFPAFFMLHYNSYLAVIFAYLMFAVPSAASFGVYNAVVCELFPTKVRYTGLSLAHNISAGVFGGFSPLICTWLVMVTEIKISPGFYIIFSAMISLVSVLQIRKSDKNIDW
ncbi:MAG: proline/betaine transporter [Candidatus Mesenet longicola]|uniref:Proline/betaine transporter n=1 Tax=Candidatus Mesenet longicola TaxID=1892558 RepID=A0A8J3HVP9_9RICK|nr:MAG: proline/betaine transporter [Candidatus Mesenet longicola]GHM59864.1 MAG: proline/betaine transporter [Candidatus Mesenet longicola]